MTMLSKLRRPRSSQPAPTQELARRHFLMQEERPAVVVEVDVAALDPFLRGLLFTDGTVTRALAVQTLAPVAVERVGQAEVPVPGDVAHYLEIEPGGESVRRRVRIGVGDGAPLLWAESHILPERLPPGFMGLLDGAPDGIGQSLQRLALESSRELLWFGLDAAPAWAGSEAGSRDDAATIRRLYRIVSEHQASILISESFAVERGPGGFHLRGLIDGAGAAPGGWA